MKYPTVYQARALCDSLKARGVIVLAFDEDAVRGSSYGETKHECKQIAYTLDQIVEALESGHLPVWVTADSARGIFARSGPKRDSVNEMPDK